jgi:tetratricopeptide (TPR) repeat protein
MRTTKRTLIFASLIACALTAGAGTLAASAETPDAATTDPSAAIDPGELRGAVEQASPRGAAYAHLMRALLALRRSEYARSAREVRQAVELQPDSVDVHIQGATLLRRMGHYSESEAMARRAVELDPDDPDALRLVADLAWERVHTSPGADSAKRDEAIRLYEELVEKGQDDDAVLQRLASLKLEAGDRAGALEVARQLVERRPGDRAATASLVQLLLEDGQQREALRFIARFIGSHADDEALLGLAERLADNLDAWELIAEELGSVELGGTMAGGLLAEAFLKSGRVEEAAAVLEQAVAGGSDDSVVRYNLAAAYRQMGRLADSASLMRQLAEEDTSDPRVFVMLAEILDDQGDTRGSLDAFETALVLMHSNDGPEAATLRDMIRGRMSRLYLERDDSQAVSRLLDEMEQPDSPDALEMAAELAVAHEDWARAKQEVRRLRSAGAVGVAAYLEGEIWAHTGRWSKAAERFAEAVEELGPFTRVRAAEVYRELGRIDDGEQLIREWVAADPTNPGPHYYLGSYLYRTDRFGQAEASLREAFRLNPEHAPALNFLGYSLAEQNERLEEALSLVQRALQVDGWNGAYLDSLGWVYFQLGRYEEARDPLERAAREYPQDGTVLEHLGDLYLKIGEVDLALAAWNRALDAGAEDETALRDKVAGAEAQSVGASTLEEREASARSAGDAPIRP